MAGSVAWIHTRGTSEPDEIAGGFLRLLPSFDAYLLRYQNRDWFVPAAYAKTVQAGGGIIRPTVLIDGALAGTWRYDRCRRPPGLRIALFQLFPSSFRPLLRAETDDVGRFLGEHPELEMPA